MKKFISAFNQLVIRWAPACIVLCLAIAAFFFAQLSQLTKETDANALLDKTDAAYLDNELVKEVFGARDMIIVGVINRGPHGIYNPESLALIRDINDYLEELDGINEDDVVSFYTQNNITGEDDEMLVETFIDIDPPKTVAEAAALRATMHKNATWLGLLASEDDQAGMVLAKLERKQVLDQRGLAKDQVYYQLEKWLAQQETGENQVVVAGRPVLEGTIGHYMERDLKVMMPIVLLVVLIVLFITLRSLRGVVLPLLVVVLSVFCSLGLMSLLQIPLYSITNIVPILLIAIGTADGIHILSNYNDNCRKYPGKTSSELVQMTMDEMWSPVVMTSLTTTAGFLALTSARMIPLQMLGYFTAVGVLAAMFFSLLLLPAILALLPPLRRIKPVHSADTPTRFGLLTDSWSLLIHDQRRAVLAMGLLVFAVSAYWGTQIVTDASFIKSFDQDSPIVIAENIMNEKFQGTIALNVVLEGTEDGAVQSPEVLNAILSFQKQVEALPNVGGSTSIAEFIARMNMVLHNDDPAYDRIPDKQGLISKYLLLYSGGPNDFEEFVDYNYRRANIRVMIRSDHSPILKQVLEESDKIAQSCFGNLPGIKYKFAGSANVSYSFITALIDSQLNSLGISLIVIFLLTSLMFGSPVAGLYNTLPIMAAIALNFGLMGFLGVPLEFATAIISAIAIGIGIDYSIHFLTKYRNEATPSSTALELTRATMQTSGRAIFFNAVVVISGFLVLLFSIFPPMIKMGSLIALNMFTCFVASVTLLPAMLNQLKPAFIFKKTL